MPLNRPSLIMAMVAQYDLSHITQFSKPVAMKVICSNRGIVCIADPIAFHCMFISWCWRAAMESASVLRYTGLHWNTRWMLVMDVGRLDKKAGSRWQWLVTGLYSPKIQSRPRMQRTMLSKRSHLVKLMFSHEGAATGRLLELVTLTLNLDVTYYCHRGQCLATTLSTYAYFFDHIHLLGSGP